MKKKGGSNNRTYNFVLSSKKSMPGGHTKTSLKTQKKGVVLIKFVEHSEEDMPELLNTLRNKAMQGLH